jgi:hypothetical protein
MLLDGGLQGLESGLEVRFAGAARVHGGDAGPRLLVLLLGVGNHGGVTRRLPCNRIDELLLDLHVHLKEDDEAPDDRRLHLFIRLQGVAFEEAHRLQVVEDQQAQRVRRRLLAREQRRAQGYGFGRAAVGDQGLLLCHRDLLFRRVQTAGVVDRVVVALLAFAQAGDRTWAIGFGPVLAALAGDMIADDDLTRDPVPVHLGLIIEVSVLGRQFGYGYELGVLGGQVDLGLQDVAQPRLVLLDDQRPDIAGHDQLFRLPLLNLAHHVGGHAQMLQLHGQVEFPDGLHLGSVSS